FFIVGTLAVVFARVVAVQQAGKEVGDLIPTDTDPGVKPGLGPYRRHVRRFIDVVSGGKLLALTESRVLLRVPLLHQAKAAKLPLDAVKVTVVVGVARHESVAANAVIDLDALDHVHGKGNLADPRPAGKLVGKIKLRRRRVAHMGLRA